MILIVHNFTVFAVAPRRFLPSTSELFQMPEVSWTSPFTFLWILVGVIWTFRDKWTCQNLHLQGLHFLQFHSLVRWSVCVFIFEEVVKAGSQSQQHSLACQNRKTNEEKNVTSTRCALCISTAKLKIDMEQANDDSKLSGTLTLFSVKFVQGSTKQGNVLMLKGKV